MSNATRREFLRASAAMGVGLYAGTHARSAIASAPSDRLQYAAIGVGIRGAGINCDAAHFAQCMAICDVDSVRLTEAHETLAQSLQKKERPAMSPDSNKDYREVLQRDDIDFVVIGTPDHWHAKIAIEAMLAGKDVYCEKPLTLTIAEGRQITDVQAQTGRVFQVGTQQRSGKMFQQAVAMQREQRVGKMRRITCGLGSGPRSEKLPVAEVPAELDWDLWLGPAPEAAYRQAPEPQPYGYGAQFPHGRAHAHFRWWYEYSGGKLTDWGAHHVDIAMWAMDRSDGGIGRFTIEPLMVDHPVELKDGMPTADDEFNTATKFHVRVTFADGVEMDLRDQAKDDLGFGNGIMFQGEEGRYFVNRSKITGKPVEELAERPLSDETYESVYPGLTGEGMWQMGNFVDCVRSRAKCISDVASHHRHLTVCHAANIAIRLGRKLTYDPAVERFVDDEQANGFLGRTSRSGFETAIA